MTPYHQHPYPAGNDAARSDPANGKYWAWIGGEPGDLRDVEAREAAFGQMIKGDHDEE